MSKDAQKTMFKVWGPTLLILSLSLLVMALAFWYRHGLLEAYIEWDEADYVYAASHGFLANWWHDWDLNRVDRHWHAPMAMYGYRFFTLIFGYESWVIYLQDVILGSAIAGLSVWAMWDMLKGLGWLRYPAALTCGLMLALSPANIGMTNTHTMASFFMVLNIWFFFRYVRQPDPWSAVTLGVSLAGQFTSMEYGWPLLISGAMILLVLKPELYLCWTSRRFSIPFHGSIWWLLGTTLMTILLIWPAGIFKGAVVLNFAYYVVYAKQGHSVIFQDAWVQHVPKYAYAYWYWTKHPGVAIVLGVLLISAILGAFGIFAVRLKKLRGKWLKWVDGVDETKRIQTATMAIVGIMLMLILAGHAAHIMFLRYSAYMVIGIFLAGLPTLLWGLHWLDQRMRSARDSSAEDDHGQCLDLPVGHWTRVCGLILMLLICIGMFSNGLPRKNKYGAGHANVALSEMLKEELETTPQGAKVLVQQFPLTRYMVLLENGREDLEVVEWMPNKATAAGMLERVKQGEFEWVLVAPSMRKRFPEDPLIKYLDENTRLRNQRAVAIGYHQIFDGQLNKAASSDESLREDSAEKED